MKKKLKPLHDCIKGRKLPEHATKVIPNKKKEQENKRTKITE